MGDIEEGLLSVERDQGNIVAGGLPRSRNQVVVVGFEGLQDLSAKGFRWSFRLPS